MRNNNMAGDASTEARVPNFNGEKKDMTWNTYKMTYWRVLNLSSPRWNSELVPRWGIVCRQLYSIVARYDVTWSKPVEVTWCLHLFSQAVRLLLDFVDRRRVYQALLSAINLGNEEIAEIIIEHPKYEEISSDLKEKGKSFFYQNKFHDDNQFSEEITPLILASQQNRFEVVMALLLKRETIEKPHKCHCTCTDCLEQAQRDELKFARSRLNAYRGLLQRGLHIAVERGSHRDVIQAEEGDSTGAREEKHYTVGMLMRQIY